MMLLDQEQESGGRQSPRVRETEMDFTAIVQTLIWAGVVSGLALFVLHKFANRFAAMVERVKKLGPAEFDVGQPAQHQIESKPESPPVGPELIPVVPGTVLEERVEMARQAVSALPSEQRLEQALRVAGFMGMVANLEWVNSQIYGSQIELLQMMTSRDIGIAEAQAKYEAVARHFPEQYRSYAFDAWLDWLVSRARVITRSGDLLSLTPLGRELLKYIVDRGYSFHRSL